ncbi:MAG: helix-turn-helix domain-containing protein [Candidatus Eiseniibacteriota bacterium]
MSKRKRATTDLLEILDKRYFSTPERQRALAEAILDAEIAEEIYALRTRARLTQKQLAARVGTTDSVISRLEDADYRGHSLRMLHRIAAALNRRVEVRFVTAKLRRKIPA